jgi:hypothetical protein
MPEATFNQAIDIYCHNVGLEMSQNNNVELRERDGFRCFPHGVTGYVISQKRIDGGWHVSTARHFRVFMCNNFVSPKLYQQIVLSSVLVYATATSTRFIANSST